MALCACGCRRELEPTDDRGRPRKFIHGHNGRGHNGPDYIVDENGCWVWQGNKTAHGYPGGQKHRRMYEEHKGAIPKGLDLDHLCRVRACVNPDHLEPVTRRENIWRSWEARLEDDASTLKRVRVAAGLSQRALAERMGCVQTSISQWERGTVRPPADAADRIFEICEGVA